MRLVCPACNEQVLVQPPTTSQPPGSPIPPYSHTDGTPLCPTMHADGYAPYWPNDLDLRIPTIPAGTLARPRRHPCRTNAGAIPAPTGQATVHDRHGGINCPATIAASHCPYAATGLLGRDQGGLQAPGCGLRVAAPHAAITALHQSGTPAPHRVPGFAGSQLDRPRVRALIDWLIDHSDTYLLLLPTAARPDAVAVLQQTVDWLRFAATTGGLRTRRRAHPVADPNTNRPGWPL